MDMYKAVDKARDENGDSTYGDFSVGFGDFLPTSSPQKKEKIFSKLRDKQGNHSPYYYYWYLYN